MSDIKHIDYVGFTFNKRHSSELGIVRTSEGSRFNENLLPTIQDKTVAIPGGDGTYFYGSFYTQKIFSISYAFDSLTEQQLMDLKSHFGDKKIHDLIFDENPYKIYRAKVTGTASIKHIPFAEGMTDRVYKGEGTIQFTAFEPYARSDKKWLNEYTNTNKIEWAAASHMKDEQGEYDQVLGANSMKLYNAGDIETHFQFKINFENGIIPEGGIILNIPMGEASIPQLNWREIRAEVGDDYIKINTKLNLIEGYSFNGERYVKSGNIYNGYITSGHFFKLPQGESELSWNGELTLDSAPIEYNYYYF